MDDIEKELEAKSIERDTNPEVDLEITEVPEVLEVLEPPVKKVKKARSEKQIAAFEKARLKRAEGIALRKQEKQDNKELKKELKKNPLAIGKVLPAIEEPSIEPSIVKEKSVPKPVVNTSPSVAGSREQVADKVSPVIQNHYYYYGVPPPEHNYNEPKKKKKTKRPPTPEPSSSESESESEEEQDTPPQVQYQPQAPKYKFSYS
tara:strand:- start:862 stop:1473 length:612 start_codon:yes stop_codon:yes gene_type:complete